MVLMFYLDLLIMLSHRPPIYDNTEEREQSYRSVIRAGLELRVPVSEWSGHAPLSPVTSFFNCVDFLENVMLHIKCTELLAMCNSLCIFKNII
jgi:hypothetical protein